MLENYKNILANKFMRDTNYIIIKDTDDLEELQRQWELFETQMTKRQQRLSDDRSIEIWNMTNQEHYESLRDELMSDVDSKYGDSEEDDNESVYYDPEEDEDNFNDDEFDNLIGLDTDNEDIPDDDNNITEPVKEDSVIPIENNDTKISEPKHYNSFLKNSQDIQKDNMADQYEIDTNMHIIGRVTGGNVDDYLSNLEKSFINFNAQTHDHRKKSDDKCREIYGMSNIERYNKLKADALKFKSVKTVEKVTSTDNETLDSSKVQQLGEFVSQVYDNMQAVNEVENLKVNKHRRFNDTPYFTPSEMIDMGVHGNHNFYCKDADNDGLITNVNIPTWFASYKDMSMDHIFEDYRNDWIDTLDLLYSDFEDIKSSGDEDKILARKQSILDLGWNPEIPFNRKNRLKASKRVSDILDKTIPKDIFINLDNIPESDDDELLSEAANKSTHKPVLLIFTQGHTPIVSQGIKLVTGSPYSHASISFDPELKEVYSFNIREKAGFIKENLDSFKDNIISVMAFFAPTKIVKQLKDKVKDFENNKTTFDLRIFFNKLLKIDHKVSKNEYHQVCSTFVDTVLKSGNINLVGDIEIPDPGQLYDHAKAIPNKIIEVFNDVATKYDGKKIKKKINSLLKTGIESIEESKNYSNIIQSQVDSIIDETIYHLKQYTTSSNYRTKYSKYKFFKLINIHKVKYGTYGGVAVVNDSPYQNSSGLYDVDYDLDKIDKNAIDWYNDLLKEGKQYAESKCDKSLLQIIDINTGDGDEGIIYFNKKKNIKPSVTDAVINAIIKADDISEKILNKIPGYEIIRKVNNHNANLKPSEKIACGIGMGLGDGISKAIFKEQTSILNEVKQFPIEFDKDGNLIIYKARTGSLSYGDEIDDSVQLLETYRNQSNIEGIKYELAKLWYINDCIEKNLKKRLKNEQYKELIDTRAVCLNVFKLNLDFVMKAEKGFNFSDYYNSTPFSDSSIKITSNTLKYTMKTIKGLI